MRRYSLPTLKQCFEMLQEYHVPRHIKRHSLAVAQLGVFLAEKLKEKGLDIDVELVRSACLLHDLVRTCDFEKPDYDKFEQRVTEEDEAKWEEIRERYKGVNHEDAAYDILKEQYPVPALTVKKHKYAGILDEALRPQTWEEKIVYYADMRVMGNRIVPLKTRLEDAHKRNVHLRESKNQSKADTAAADALIYEMEKEIFAILGLDPLSVTCELVEAHRHKQQM